MAKDKLPRGITLRGGRFQVNVSIKGAGRTSGTVDTVAEAVILQEQLRKDLLNKGKSLDGVEPTGKFSWTLSHACERTLSLPAPEGWAGSKGERVCKINAKTLKEFFGATTPISKISPDDLDNFIADCQKGGNTPATINRKLAALSKIMGVAEDRSRGEYRKPKFPRRLRENKGRIRQFSLEEEAQILEFFRLNAMLNASDITVVLIDTGMRVSELFALEDQDVSITERLILIYGANANGTKNGEFRSVPMTNRVQKIFERRKFSHPEKPFPFDGFQFGRMWAKVRSHMDMDDDAQFIPHTLRHTCASRLVQKKISLKVVQEWLGHKTIQMTQRYAHLYPKDLMDARDALEPNATENATSRIES